jgi:PHP family Zn ribbon phosphoesterase
MASFNCISDNYEIEKCKHCGCTDFQMRETLSTAIVCAKCQKFHKRISERVATQGQMLDEMFEFARKNGE